MNKYWRKRRSWSWFLCSNTLNCTMGGMLISIREGKTTFKILNFYFLATTAFSKPDLNDFIGEEQK